MKTKTISAKGAGLLVSFQLCLTYDEKNFSVSALLNELSEVDKRIYLINLKLKELIPSYISLARELNNLAVSFLQENKLSDYQANHEFNAIITPYRERLGKILRNIRRHNNTIESLNYRKYELKAALNELEIK